MPSDAALVMEGQQFRDAVLTPDGSVDYAAFNAIWPNLRVLARCSPKDKYTIVRGATKGQRYRGAPDGICYSDAEAAA